MDLNLRLLLAVISTILVVTFSSSSSSSGVYSQYVSPCPGTFTYIETNATPGVWIGQVILTMDVEGLWIRIKLNRKVERLVNWIGDVTSEDNRNYIVKAPKEVLKEDVPYLWRFQVGYNQNGTQIPGVEKIVVNGDVVCVFKEKAQQQQHANTRTVQSSDFIDIDDVPSILRKDEEEECGRPIQRGIGLILFGENSREGAWPWHAALYRNDRYSCGATLISEKNLITASHCVAAKGSRKPINPSKIKIRLGMTKLGDELDEDVHARTYNVDSISIHPEYNHTYFNNDIAVLRVADTVEFNDYIRPICLWAKEDTRDRIGHVGTAVGWGITETEQIAKELKEIRMPAVDRFACIRSNQKLYPLVNERNFCAGYRNGTSVCNGDSGGGLYFKREGSTAHDPVWQLGGLVSASLSINIDLCDPHNYILFTDVPQFTDWIITQQIGF